METQTVPKQRHDMATFKKTKASSPSLSKILVTALGAWLISLFTLLDFVKQLLAPIYRLIYASHHPVVVRTPEDSFVSARLDELGYTFTSNYLTVPLGAGRALEQIRMHYIDECPNGDPASSTKGTILCLHGEPTWSFLYRKMVPQMVAAGYRVVVPDMIGFGKSDKYVDMDNYTHELHTFALKHLMDQLGLQDIILVCQDWGGITGLSVVKDMPDRFATLVLMNTAAPVGIDHKIKNDPLNSGMSAIPFLLWRSAVSFFGTNLPVSFLFRYLVGFDASVTKAYTAPFPDKVYKGGVAKWPLMVPLFKDDPVAQHMIEVRSCLRVWRKPVLLVWGEKELVTKSEEQAFLDLLPKAKHITIQGAKHFLQETHGEEIARNIVQFLSIST